MNKCSNCKGTGRVALLLSTERCPECLGSGIDLVAEAKAGKSGALALAFHIIGDDPSLWRNFAESRGLPVGY